MPISNTARVAHRVEVIDHLEEEASMFAQYAAATKSHRLHDALLRLVAAQVEVATVLRAHNIEEEDKT